MLQYPCGFAGPITQFLWQVGIIVECQDEFHYGNGNRSPRLERERIEP